MPQIDVWGYLMDGLFVIFLITVISGIAASSGSFNALLFAMFGQTAESQLATINVSWRGNLSTAIGRGAETLLRVTEAASQVYPLATYITVFSLFIGAVLGIVIYAMSLVSSARTAVPVPVRPV